jgi:hypothetical protein
MLDKNKYSTPQSIVDGVRKSAKNFFDKSAKGKGVGDTVVKKVYKNKIKEK